MIVHLLVGFLGGIGIFVGGVVLWEPAAIAFGLGITVAAVVTFGWGKRKGLYR